MELPLCAYCGLEITDPEKAHVFELGDLPGAPRVAYHYDPALHCCEEDVWANDIKNENGDEAAIVHIMKRGPGRVRGTPEWGDYLDEHHPDWSKWKDMKPTELFGKGKPDKRQMELLNG